MYSNKQNEKGSTNIFLSWPFLIFKMLILVLAAVYLQQPTGSLEGKVAFEQGGGFHLYSTSLENRKVSAVAIGPRGNGTEDERGVWINPDGSFRLDQLPVGEYSLRIRAPGYGTEYYNDIYVDDGRTTTVPAPIELSLLTPSVSIATNVRVFTTQDKPHFWANVTGSKSINVKIYRDDFVKEMSSKTFQKAGYSLSSPLSLSHDDYEHPAQANFFAKRHPIRQLHRDVTLDFSDSARVDFALSKPLPPGDYFAVAESPSLNNKDISTAMMSFMVTDIGMIVKRAPDMTLVRAINLNTLKAIQGAEITISRPGSTDPVLKGTTGADGFAKINHTTGDEPSIPQVITGKFNGMHAYGGIDYWQSDEGKYQCYTYTDRPIYRLGQTVYFKGMLRQLTAAGNVNSGAGDEIHVSIENPDNNVIQKMTLKTNSHGTFHGSFVVPENDKTGGYQIMCELPDSTTAYEYVTVDEYRKPEYQVEMTPVAPRVVAGMKAQVRVKAHYYFGGAVSNAKVDYHVYSSPDWGLWRSLMPRPKYYAFFDDWDDSDSSYTTGYSSGSGDYSSEGTVQTDANGEAVITFDTQPINRNLDQPYDSDYADKSYTVQADVTDLSRMTVSSSGSVEATPADFELFVSPKSYVVKVGDKFDADVSAIDYDGKPVANQPVEVKLVRFMYDRVKSEYRGKDVKETVNVVTDAQGKASVSFKSNDQWPTDTFYVVAQSKDKTNHLAYGSSSIWIASERYQYSLSSDAAEKQAFEIKLDKEIYSPGETAKAMITAPLTGNEGAEAIISVEGTRIYSYKVVPMTATAQLVEVPIDPTFVPNAFVTVTLVAKKHQYYTCEKMIRVSPQQNFLNISVAADKKKYRPGETAKYTIKATHLDGTPAPNTEVSLGLVDESIYAIQPDTTQNIQKFFYRKRQNWVVTTCSFPEDYSGGPDKAEPRVRKDFRDTAAWIPELVTGKDGQVTTSIKLPDNLTSWRATVRGIDDKTDVGSATSNITVTQDLIVRLGLPRFFTQGDEGTVTAVVHNYTDKVQSVKVTLSPSPELKPSTPLMQTLSIKPEGIQSVNWPVTLTRSGSCVVSVKAIGQTASDAVEQKLPVRALGIPAFTARSGLITDENGSVQIPVGITGDAVPGSSHCELSLAASTIGPVLGNFDQLIDYPYGCTEQTMSKMIPSVVAYKLHDELGLPISDKLNKKFGDAYKQSMDKLTTYRHADGGWGWWANDESNPYLTCLVVEGLGLIDSVHEYKQGGVKMTRYATHEEWIKGAVKWLTQSSETLQKQLSDPHHVTNWWTDNEYRTDMCRMLYTIGMYDKLPKASLQWMLGQYKQLSPEPLAYLTLALNESGDKTNAKLVYNRLIEIANKDGNYVNWEHTPAMIKRFAKEKMIWDYSYRYTGVETTALALETVLKMDPDNRQVIEAVKQWLLLQRDKDGWENTKTTAEVFEVLLDEELLARAKWPANFTADASLTQKAFADYLFNRDDEYQQERKVVVPLTQTPTPLTIKKTGTGRLYYSTVTTFFRQLKPGDQVAEKALPQGLTLKRSFYRLTPVITKADGNPHFRTDLITDGKVKAGETILMKVQVESPVTVPYVMMEAALPSGAEVVKNSGEENNMVSNDKGDSSFEGDWGSTWWSHQDILDDRIVFFGTTMQAGKCEFHTLLRMEMPGKFNVDPVSIEGMYTKSVRGYSPLDQLTVTE